jgi:PKD repeat protein
VKKAASGIMLFLLFVSMSTSVFNIKSAKASGTIYIRADGSIDLLWPMFQHDSQHSGRGDVEGPGISEKPSTNALLNLTTSDSFSSPIIDSQGNLYIGASIKGLYGLYAFSSLGIQNWFYANATPLIITRKENVFCYMVESNTRSKLELFDTSGHLLWETLLEGRYPAMNSIMEDNGVIYMLTNPISGNSYELIAIDEETGIIFWTYETKGYPSTPAMDKSGVIYFGCGDTLFAVNSDGTEKWQRSFPAFFLDGSQHLGITRVRDPLVRDDGTVIVIIDSEKQWQSLTNSGWFPGLHAIDPENPNLERWETKYDMHFWNAVLATGKSDDIFVTGFYDPGMAASTLIFSYSREGTLNWMKNVASGNPPYPRSIVVDSADRIYIQFTDGLSIGYNIQAFYGNGTRIWSINPPSRRQGVLSLGANWTLYSAGETCLFTIAGVLPTPPPPPPPSDTEPPAIIENLIASSAENKQVTLRWTNPPDSDLAEIVILRNLEEYPDNHFDGERVYASTSPSPNAEMEFIDTALINGRVYRYAVFSWDSSGNWNDSVIEGNNAAMATPSNPSNQPPEARFVYSPIDPKLTKTWKSITFDASSSSDDHEIALYEWDFDGNGVYDWSTNQPKVTFVYEEKGTYNVGLRVTDDDGTTDIASSSIIISEWSLFQKLRWDYNPPDPLTQISDEDYQYIKNKLYIFTLSDDLTEYWNFRNYYDSEDSKVGSWLHSYGDSDLKRALSLEIDHEHSPGLTYGIKILDALKEMDKVEQVWTQGYKLKASAYFTDLLDANSKWTSQFDTESLLNNIQEILLGIIEEIQPKSGVLGAGTAIIGLVNDCTEAGVPIYNLVKLLYYNTLYRYFDLRHSGESHLSAWQEVTQVPTEDYHLPSQITDNPQKLAATENLFKRLYDTYGGYFDNWDEFTAITKKDERSLINELAKRINLVGHIVIVPHSPVEVRICNNDGNVTGLVNGTVVQNISDSECNNETGIAAVLSTGENLHFQVVGTCTGNYGLEIILVETSLRVVFSAHEIPIKRGETHDFSIDWNALSSGEEGVIVMVDSDGNGVFEHTFASDSVLTQSEFLAQTAPRIPVGGYSISLTVQAKPEQVSSYIGLVAVLTAMLTMLRTKRKRWKTKTFLLNYETHSEQVSETE